MDSTLPPIFPTPPSKNAQRCPPAPCASKGTSPGLATAGATTVTRFPPQLNHSKVSLWQRPLAITPRINRRQRTGGGIDCAEGDSGPPRYAVRPAGRAPARLAVHCYLATGGPGAAMPHAPFGRPRRPLGTFPRGESTSSARRRTKPPTRNTFLVEGKGKSLSCFPRITKDFASAEATKGLSGRPLEAFGSLLQVEICARNNFLAKGRKMPFSLFRITNIFASAEATREIPPRPLSPLSLAKNIPSTAWRIRNIKDPRPSRPKAAEARGSILPKDSSFSR